MVALPPSTEYAQTPSVSAPASGTGPKTPMNSDRTRHTAMENDRAFLMLFSPVQDWLSASWTPTVSMPSPFSRTYVKNVEYPHHLHCVRPVRNALVAWQAGKRNSLSALPQRHHHAEVHDIHLRVVVEVRHKQRNLVGPGTLPLVPLVDENARVRCIDGAVRDETTAAAIDVTTAEEVDDDGRRFGDIGEHEVLGLSDVATGEEVAARGQRGGACAVAARTVDVPVLVRVLVHLRRDRERGGSTAGHVLWRETCLDDTSIRLDGDDKRVSRKPGVQTPLVCSCHKAGSVRARGTALP